MNSLEKMLIKDTVLSGGLIAVAVAWIAFSALQGSVPAPANEATVSAVPAQAVQRALAGTPPAAPSKVQCKV